MTAGRDNNVAVISLNHSFVLVFNDISSESSFLVVGKAQLFQSVCKHGDVCAVIVSHKGRSNAGVNWSAGFDNFLYLVNIVSDFLCILWTVYTTFSAEDSFVMDNMLLVVFKSYGFYMAMSYTFVTVAAVRGFKLNTRIHRFFLLLFFKFRRYI